MIGKTTLRQIRNYSDDELLAISQIGYHFLMQGKNEESRVIFEGLIAIDPQNDFYYRALGVVFQRLGDYERAMKQFVYAAQINPGSPYAYVNRAEILISQGEANKAEPELRLALERMGPKDEQLSKKAWALLRVATEPQAIL
jgi:tetratricopeptide (TPR) repeat protein